MKRALALALALTACAQDEENLYSQSCQDLCSELITSCGYTAFPSTESCLQGCSWNESEGAAIAEQLACVQDAACDTFLIVECEHEYGVVE